MNKLRLILKQLLSRLPSKLPVGVSEFNTFADSIIELGGDYADHDSLRFAIASMVIHLPAGTASVSKHFFVRGLRKSAANQVASQVFQDIKLKKEKELAEETAKSKAEASCQVNTPN